MVISRSPTPQQPVEHEIFVDNGHAVAFYLYGTQEPHSAWALSEGARDALADKIIGHGGSVCGRRGDARVILVSHPEGLEGLKRQYSTRHVHVERPTFVDACIRNRHYGHKAILQKGMGGRMGGRDRQPFTEEDEKRLCEYLAARIPDQAAGGRTGTGVYEEIIQIAQENPDEPDLAWALRHPAESWRERYKKNRARLDPRIDRLVAAHPPPPDGKGLYHLSRLANKRRQHAEFMQQNAQHQFEEAEDAEEEEQEAGEFVAQLEDEWEFEEPHPGRGRRRTDIGPQRHKQGLQRDGRRSAPDRIPPRNSREPSPPGEFERSFDDLEGVPFEPPSPQAGPSGTQRTPSPSPPPAKKRPAPRPIRPVAARRPAADQVPMSSQATLVNPTQPRSEQGDAARPQKRQKTHAQPYVLIDPARGRAQHKRGQHQPKVQEDEDEGPMDEYELEEDVQSHPVGRTNEDALEVENILGGSFEGSGRAFPDMEVMDSEDERVRKKLSLGPLRTGRAAVDSSRAVSAASRNLKQPPFEIEDMAAFAQVLDLGFGNASRPVSGSSGSGSSESVLSQLVSRAPGRGAVTATPSASRSLARAPSVAESTSASVSSSEKGRDPVNRVPLDGTRASAEKKKARESAGHEEYVPEVGTRAAEVALSGKRLRSRQLAIARR